MLNSLENNNKRDWAAGNYCSKRGSTMKKTWLADGKYLSE
jgi:hypothetical protein